MKNSQDFYSQIYLRQSQSIDTSTFEQSLVTQREVIRKSFTLKWLAQQYNFTKIFIVN